MIRKENKMRKDYIWVFIVKLESECYIFYYALYDSNHFIPQTVKTYTRNLITM